MNDEKFARFIEERTASINAIAYGAGELAYRVGRPLSSCEFKDEKFAEVWRQGWLSAEDEALARMSAE